jgi:poly(U)-specific endoribonuclease
MAHPPTHTKATVTDVKTDSIFHAVWDADKARIKAFHETRFPQDMNNGRFVVKVCDAPRKGSAKAHNLFKLYKWNDAKHCYEKSDNKALLQDPAYKSYKLVYDLFDNYESDETKPEVNTKEECQEIMDFLNYVVDSEPIKVAAAYLRQKYSSSNNVDREDKESFASRVGFLNKLKKIWFDQYDWGKMLSLSGFEHTFIGERRADGQVMGYHFWYKYFVDDSVDNATGQDAIDFNKRMDDGASDDYIAIRFAQFVDADGDGVIDGASDSQLFKSFGSFFVGCSAECKMALGTIAYYEAKAAWAARRKALRADDRGHDDEGVLAKINGHMYKLSMHRGGDKHQYCRSFFPEKA